jgi:hypothetical protein
VPRPRDQEEAHFPTFVIYYKERSARGSHKIRKAQQKESVVRIVTVYLKGGYAPGGKDWDRGIVRLDTGTSITLASNEYGKDSRTYQKGDVARIEETGHW